MAESVVEETTLAIAPGDRRTRRALLQHLRDGLAIIAITAFLFLLIEGGVRLAFPQDVRTTYVSGGALAAPDPELGHVNLPGADARIEAPEFSVDYRISRQGFRDDAIYSAVKPAGTTRILVLGDSFAQGSGNAYRDIWPVLTENELRRTGHKVEIIKAGVFGFDTRQETLYLERLYNEYRPDIVVMAMVLHDVFTNAPIGSAGIFEPAVQKLADKKSELHSLILLRRLLMANDDLYSRLYLNTQRREWFAAPPTTAARRQVDVTRNLFNRAATFCHQKGCQFVVLSIPQLFQVIAVARGKGESGGIDISWIDKELARFASEKGFAWVSLLPALASRYKATGRDLYHRYDGHLNAAGNRIAAEIATAALTGRIGRTSDRRVSME